MDWNSSQRGVGGWAAPANFLQTLCQSLGQLTSVLLVLPLHTRIKATGEHPGQSPFCSASVYFSFEISGVGFHFMNVYIRHDCMNEVSELSLEYVS